MGREIALPMPPAMISSSASDDLLRDDAFDLDRVLGGIEGIDAGDL